MLKAFQGMELHLLALPVKFWLKILFWESILAERIIMADKITKKQDSEKLLLSLDSNSSQKVTSNALVDS